MARCKWISLKNPISYFFYTLTLPFLLLSESRGERRNNGAPLTSSSSLLSDNDDLFHSPQTDLRDNSRIIVIVKTTSAQFTQAAPRRRNPSTETRRGGILQGVRPFPIWKHRAFGHLEITYSTFMAASYVGPAKACLVNFGSM